MKKLKQLPDNLKKEVIDFIDFLLQKHKKKLKRRKLKFNWEGSLSELKQKYSSVELQTKTLE